MYGWGVPRGEEGVEEKVADFEFEWDRPDGWPVKPTEAVPWYVGQPLFSSEVHWFFGLPMKMIS